MHRAEAIILAAFVLVGAGAFALELAGPDTVRIVGIVFCCLLILLLVVGLVLRARVKKRRALEAMRQERLAISEPDPEAGENAAQVAVLDDRLLEKPPERPPRS